MAFTGNAPVKGSARRQEAQYATLPIEQETANHSIKMIKDLKNQPSTTA
tara:strand:- start:3 stop:149 length:147 start_codon:yes stop_codon:yes gene_type:complete